MVNIKMEMHTYGKKLFPSIEHLHHFLQSTSYVLGDRVEQTMEDSTHAQSIKIFAIRMLWCFSFYHYNKKYLHVDNFNNDSTKKYSI
jgi:hypothetical protein